MQEMYGIDVDENLIAMTEMSDLNKPALAACVSEVERYFDSREASELDLRDSFSKQAVGRMVKTVLAPFGYETAIQRDMPKNSGSKYFASATCYRKTRKATMKVVKTIVEIDESIGGE